MSPLGAAIFALILTVVIGYVVGQVVVVVCILIGTGFAAAEHGLSALAMAVLGWVLAVGIWVTTIVLALFRIGDLIAAAT